MMRTGVLLALLVLSAPLWATERDWTARLNDSFAIDSSQSIIGAADLGLVNGRVTFNGWKDDVACVRGLYAPPYFSKDFYLEVRFDGCEVRASRYRWRPDVLVREGARNGWRIRTRLFPLHGKRGALMEVCLSNATAVVSSVDVAVEAVGTVGKNAHWGFNKPTSESRMSPGGQLHIDSSAGARIALASDALERDRKVTFSDVGLGESRVFHLAFALDGPEEAERAAASAVGRPAEAIRDAHEGWNGRLRDFAARMPEFDCDDPGLVHLYCRSLLHLLLVEWNVDQFRLHPYYATGGVNGGCICNYLWNFGGPHRLWPLLDSQALKEHLKVFLDLDLGSCYAFSPSDGSPQGPYYPINQEKILFLIDAYVRETGDVGFLRETHRDRTFAEWAVEMALAHDDLSKDAVLADYGAAGKSHLELRTDYLYDGVMPDLNLRRIALLHMADRLCRMAGHDPKVNLAGRAEALKKLVRKELWDADAGWFRAICSDGKPTLRYTMQMFKALGWGEKVLDKDVEAALVKHLMDPKEFLGSHGVHSLSKLDPAYDESDVDNGGPGACPSFAPAICDRLYRDGRFAEANDILMRLRWLGTSLPYWGDSQYADRADYRRDTPLQCDVEGACLAQTIVFGLFGVTIDDDLKVSFDPHLPKGVGRMRISNLRLAGKVYEVDCSSDRRISVRAR